MCFTGSISSEAFKAHDDKNKHAYGRSILSMDHEWVSSACQRVMKQGGNTIEKHA